MRGLLQRGDNLKTIIISVLIIVIIGSLIVNIGQDLRLDEIEQRIETLENQVESMSYQKNDYNEIIQEIHLLLDRIDEQEGW